MTKFFVLFFTLLFAQLALAGPAQVNNVSSAGGQIDSTTPTFTIPNGADPVVLEASVASITSSGDRLFFTADGAGSQAQYKLPSGSKLHCPGHYMTWGTASNGGYEFGYNTATFTNDTATAAGDVCFAASCTAGVYPRSATLSSNVAKWFPIPVKWDASATGANADIYPWVRVGQGTGNVGVVMICYKY